MPAVSTLVDVYFDINILLAAVTALWALAALGLRAAGLGHRLTVQLVALRWLFVLAVAGPVLLTAADALSAGAVATVGQGINLTDLLLAQYLQGNLTIGAADMETVLGLRARAVEALASPASALPALIVAGLALGLGVGLCRLVCGGQALRRVLAGSFLVHRTRGLEVRLSDTVSVPFSAHLLRRRIVVLPSAMLAAPQDMRIALAHEIEHFRMNDVRWELLAEIARPLFFWNPAFYLWRRRAAELRELACDRRVLARRGFDAAGYAGCLVRVCRDGLRRRTGIVAGLPVVALVEMPGARRRSPAARMLRRRMEALATVREDRMSASAAALFALPLLAAATAALLAIQRPADWSQDRIMLTTIVNLERLERINGAGGTFGQPSLTP